MFSLRQLTAIAGQSTRLHILEAIQPKLGEWLSDYDLARPHRCAHFLAQVGHESDGFRTTKEYGGTTRANRMYDTRTDLGNTPEMDGDGALYMGRGLIQITGKFNYKRCGEALGLDLLKRPELLELPEWALKSACWFWSWQKLNRYADENDIEMVTRRINGGVNGYADRVDRYTRTALVLLDFEPTLPGIINFQNYVGLKPDGISGPRTRAKLHEKLKELKND